MEEYTSNSNKSKEKKYDTGIDKKIEKIVSGAVKTKKKNKLVGVFIPDDVDNVKSYIIEDVVVPAVKDVILDAVRAFLGVNGSAGKKTSASKVSYRKYYESNNRREYEASRSRNNYEFDDIILDNRGEAEEVLMRMNELIATYGLVSVADFYDLVGVTGNYTDNNYGWSNIRNARIESVRDGYRIRLPRAIPID